MSSTFEKEPVIADQHGEIIDIGRLMEMLPHHYPMLLVDRIVDYKLGEYAVGLKRFSHNEPYCVGISPVTPMVPGSIIIESMAQTAAALVMKTLGDYAEGNLTYFTSVEKTRFIKPILPGETIHIRAELLRSKRMIWKLKAEVHVDQERRAYSSFTAKVLA